MDSGIWNEHRAAEHINQIDGPHQNSQLD